MFVTVKALTTLIDNNLRYVAEAKESKEEHEETEYNDYMATMETKLKKQLEELKLISSSEKLIARYESIIMQTF